MEVSGQVVVKFEGTKVRCDARVSTRCQAGLAVSISQVSGLEICWVPQASLYCFPASFYRRGLGNAKATLVQLLFSTHLRDL